MIDYSILHHVHGRIRIDVPLIKNLSIKELRDRFSNIEIPEGIKDFRTNPITGTIVINYDPKKVNIIEYLLKISKGDGFSGTGLKGGGDE